LIIVKATNNYKISDLTDKLKGTQFQIYEYHMRDRKNERTIYLLYFIVNPNADGIDTEIVKDELITVLKYSL
jgi:hypothetical protein